MSRINLTPEEAEELGADKYLGAAPHAVMLNLANVTEDPEVQAKMPHIAEALERLAEGLGEVFDEINWGMDPENPVQDGAAADRRAMAAFRAAVGQDEVEGVDE
jgi:hypothetical protein